MPSPKNIAYMINIIAGDITDSSCWPSYSLTSENKIDTIVNAAKPTLMGSNQGVDGALHSKIDSILEDGLKFKDLICRELNSLSSHNAIRCKRGHAVTTKGYGLCNQVIHVVGSKYDGNMIEKIENGVKITEAKKHHICTSSCIHTLESCYYNIIEEIKKNPDIRFLGIPIIGSGEYQFPFELAVNIAIASIGNALLDWQSKDAEYFELVNLEKIYFFVYDSDSHKLNEKLIMTKQTLSKYRPYFQKNRPVVFQSSTIAHFRYMKELWKYDSQKGYFAIARGFRLLLMLLRTVFIPTMRIKDIFGKIDWYKRRHTVEICVFIKTLFPLALWGILKLLPMSHIAYFEVVFKRIIIIFLIDTVTYLLVLIIMADIQRPSANLIRSMIMLLLNYIEISCDLAFLYYIHYDVRFREALAFGFLGEKIIDGLNTATDYLLVTANAGLKFFLITLVFGYFFNQMREREFRS